MLSQNNAELEDSRLHNRLHIGGQMLVLICKILELCVLAIIHFFYRRLALHRIIPVRSRYVLTKSNTPRLRYGVAVLTMLLGVSFVYVAAMSWEKSSEAQAVEIAGLTEEDKQTAQPDVAEAEKESIAETIQRGLSGKIEDVAAIMKAPPKPHEKSVKMKSGDTLAGILNDAGLNNQESYQLVKAMSKHYDPRSVKAGQIINLHFDPVDENTDRLTEMRMALDPIKDVIVSRNEDGKFVSDLREKEVERKQYAFATKIETSLYGSAARAGIPAPIIAEMIHAYSWNVDFQRDIRPGDKVEVLYEVYETEDGEFARYGDILYANLGVGGNDKPIYRYEMADGMVDFFHPDGISIRKTLMRTPVDGARLSSGYGMRKHPVLGYNKMHKGVDFAAPIGTPIYAAGDGVVEVASRNGGYGNYVRLRHNSSLKTAYAHLHKFKSGITPGKHVKQGDVIGYIGTTGRSTGPHLHYEVLVNGAQKNPRSIDLPTGEQLKGTELAKFKSSMDKLQKRYVSLTDGVKYAHSGNGQTVR